MPAALKLSRARRLTAVVALGLAMAVPAAGASANAATVSSTHHVRTTAAVAARVLSLAASKHGAPYRYGGSGPNSFDCSGFTSWVFSHVGISLSHNAAAQYGEVRHIAKADKRPGDLIFMYGGGGIYHVGIYAGGGQMWAATHTGDVVRKEPIYSSSYLVGRA